MVQRVPAVIELGRLFGSQVRDELAESRHQQQGREPEAVPDLGRIVARCLELAHGETVGLDDLGGLLRADFGPEHRAWVSEMVHGLARDGLVAIHEESGETRVSLP